MQPLRSGQEAVLSWRTGAVECRIVAAAGAFVLLRPERRLDPITSPNGPASLTYLDGMVPMGFDGDVQSGGEPGELRFRVTDPDRAADRRSSVRVPLFAAVALNTGEEVLNGQLLDVSAGGMRFRHPGRLQPGQLVRLTCTLPGGMVIDADAAVRAAEQGVTSVEFTTMHGVDQQTLGRWTVNVLRSALNGQG
jgi:hypothetical protein